MTDDQAAAGFALLLICFTVYLCFRGIAWVLQHGWRSMLGLVSVRGEAVLDVEDDPPLTHEAASDEEMRIVGEAAEAGAFDAWEAGLACRPRIAQYERRMDRWSS